jgi:hypothetical protein
MPRNERSLSSAFSYLGTYCHVWRIVMVCQFFKITFLYVGSHIVHLNDVCLANISTPEFAKCAASFDCLRTHQTSPPPMVPFCVWRMRCHRDGFVFSNLLPAQQWTSGSGCTIPSFSRRVTTYFLPVPCSQTNSIEIEFSVSKNSECIHVAIQVCCMTLEHSLVLCSAAFIVTD